MYLIGNKISFYIESIFAPLKILPISIKAMVRGRKTKRKSFQQLFFNEIYDSGISAIPIIIILGFFVGIVVILLFPFDKISFGIKNIYGSVYSTFILRELAPIFTTLVVLVRSTISITIELTQMKIDGEIEALEIMGINPVQYLGSIKVFAGTISVPVLTIYFTIAAFVSGMLSVFFFYKLLPIEFLKEIISTITIKDLVVYLIRTFVSGFLIFIIAIYNGLSAHKNISMIKLRTIRAITTSIFIIILFNSLVTVGIYGIK